jgi:hypothetical protein
MMIHSMVIEIPGYRLIVALLGFPAVFLAGWISFLEGNAEVVQKPA